MGPGGPGVPMSPLGPCRQSVSSRAQNVFIIVENTFLICVVTSFWIEGSLAGEDKLFRWRKRWPSRSSKATSVNKNLWLNRDWKRVFYGFQFLWAFFGSQVASWSEIYEFHLFFSFPEIYLTDTVDHFILQYRSEDTVTPMKMSQAFPLYTSGKIVWLQFNSLVLPEIPSSGKSEAESRFEFWSLFILIPTWNAKYISSSLEVFNQTQAVSQTTVDDTERVKSHVSRWRLTQPVCFWSEIIRNAYLFYSLLTLLSQIHELASFLDDLKLFLQT